MEYKIHTIPPIKWRTLHLGDVVGQNDILRDIHWTSVRPGGVEHFIKGYREFNLGKFAVSSIKVRVDNDF